MQKVPHYLNRGCHGDCQALIAARHCPAEQGTSNGAGRLATGIDDSCRRNTIAVLGAGNDVVVLGRGLCRLALPFARSAGSRPERRGRTGPASP